MWSIMHCFVFLFLPRYGAMELCLMWTKKNETAAMFGGQRLPSMVISANTHTTQKKNKKKTTYQFKIPLLCSSQMLFPVELRSWNTFPSHIQSLGPLSTSLLPICFCFQDSCSIRICVVLAEDLVSAQKKEKSKVWCMYVTYHDWKWDKSAQRSKIAARYVVTNHCLNMHSAWFCLETLYFNMAKEDFPLKQLRIPCDPKLQHLTRYKIWRILQMICDTSGSKGQ